MSLFAQQGPFRSEYNQSVGNEVLQLGGKKVLIITDPGVVKANLVQPIKASCEGAGVSYVIYDEVKPEPR